jgi:hypothetical protein
MRWEARGTIALLVSALVGVTAGVVVGLTSGQPGPSTADDGGPSASPSLTTGSPDDPLGVGAPLQNLDCTGETILVVGWGNSVSPILNAVSSNLDAGVKYLSVDDSCNTLYGAEKQPAPLYAAYLGPFNSIHEPCELRMSIDHARDVVTTLKRGIKIHVQCLCAMTKADLPDLRLHMVADTRDGIFIRALQRLLVDIDKPVPVTGVYDERTANAITHLQELNAIDPRLYGKVEEQTWQLLKDRACLQYDF